MQAETCLAISDSDFALEDLETYFAVASIRSIQRPTPITFQFAWRQGEIAFALRGCFVSRDGGLSTMRSGS